MGYEKAEALATSILPFYFESNLKYRSDHCKLCIYSITLKTDVYAYDKEIKINLMNWVHHLNEQGVFVNDHFIKEKGRRIQEEFNKRARSQRQSHLNFRSGRISRFKYRMLSRVDCTSSTFKVPRIRMCYTYSELLSRAVMVLCTQGAKPAYGWNSIETLVPVRNR